MHIVHVAISVKPAHLDAFKIATLENARHSLLEPGILRFDVLQQTDDPARFTLVEVYRTTADQAAHRLTTHYAKWRDTVGDMMAEPRAAKIFSNLFPADSDW